MKPYTLQPRIDINKLHYKNANNPAGTVRKTKKKFSRRRETPSAIQNLVEKIELFWSS